MSSWLIVVVGIIYTAISVDQGLKGNTGLCVTFAGYAFSNIGLYWLAR